MTDARGRAIFSDLVERPSDVRAFPGLEQTGMLASETVPGIVPDGQEITVRLPAR